MNGNEIYSAAEVAQKNSDFPTAISKYESLLTGNDWNHPAAQNLFDLYLQTGDLTSASKLAARATDLFPKEAAYQNQLGLALFGLERFDEAEKAFERTLALRPDLTAPAVNIAVIQSKQNGLGKSLKTLRAILSKNPNDYLALLNCGVVLSKLGRSEEALAYLDNALEQDPESFECAQNRIGLINYVEEHSMAYFYEQASAFWRIKNINAAAIEPYRHVRSENQGENRPLRIGFVSADFKNHPVGRLLEPVLKAHDKKKIHTTLYSNFALEDEFTKTIRSVCDVWCEIVFQSDAEAAQTIYGDKIDILVDLSGHTAGNRLGVFQYKPAPVQMTWLGFVATTGLKEIDYIITDQHVLPVENEPYFSERPLRLKNSLLCYQPSANENQSNLLRTSTHSGVAFGCFNRVEKLNKKLILMWSQILASVSGSRLMIKHAHLSDEDIASWVTDLLIDGGIDAERITLRGATSYQEHLATYDEIDITLDTYPYAGTMTTLESLWMGVPVVSLFGDTWASRVGKSVLTTVGLPDLIAGSEQDYIDKAVALARDADARATLRRSMRARMESSPLLDVTQFTRELEQTYLAAWQAWTS